ncbi:hypothetical protein LOC54_12015, partial [Acetobacter sp. AN02]|uniref:hypothetical protein n=1 Tax=Acetobacter sp. AN02 TaxID=2894186 RepID=UPI00243B9F6F|nr:hypothetical protein [Acetobacter sp. AN02]
AAGTSGNGSVGNGGGSVASTVTYDAATGATDALGHHGQMQLDDHMTYTGSSADGTTDFYTVYGHRPAGTASSGQAVLSAGTGYTLPSQRFDYYGISSAGNQALLDLMFPPVSTAHSVYNTATAIAAGDYKGAAWEAAPLAAGAVGGVAAKVAGKIIGSGTIREAVESVAGFVKRRGAAGEESGLPGGSVEIQSMGAKANAPAGFKAYQAPNGDKYYESPEGLIYGPGSKDGDRISHVLAHTAEDTTKAKHSVFNVQGDDALALVDEAWAKRSGSGTTQSNGNQVWSVDLGRVVGTEGETSVQIIVRKNTSDIITAFPK